MQKSSFYMGLGIGLIFGAILLQLMNLAGEMDDLAALPGTPEEQSAQDGPAGITEEQWLELAGVFGYQPVKKHERLYTEEELNESLRKAREEERMAARAEWEQKAEETAHYGFYIQWRMDAEKVGELLQAMGLADSAEQFANYMKEKGLSGRIRTGAYHFEGKPTMEEIAERITTVP